MSPHVYHWGRQTQDGHFCWHIWASKPEDRAFSNQLNSHLLNIFISLLHISFSEQHCKKPLFWALTYTELSKAASSLVKESKMINSPMLMQSDSRTATDYSKSSQLRQQWRIFVLLCMELFCLGTPLKKILHVHSQWLDPAKEQVTVIPRLGGLEGHQLSNVPMLKQLCNSNVSLQPLSPGLVVAGGTLESWSADSPWGAVRVDVATANLFPNSVPANDTDSLRRTQRVQEQVLWPQCTVSYKLGAWPCDGTT